MRITCLGLASLLLAALPTLAAADAPAYYDVSFELEQHGQPMGHPRLLLEPGEPAELLIQKGSSSEPGYKFHMVANPVSLDDGSAGVALSAKIFRRKNDAWYRASSADFQVQPGKPVNMTLGDRRGGKPAELSVSVTAKPLTEAEYEKLRGEMEPAAKP